MSILVTFADGHSTLVIDRAAADQIVAYWPQLKATIRDLDQEARDREEMIGLLEHEFRLLTDIGGKPTEWESQTSVLLKRLGRLP